MNKINLNNIHMLSEILQQYRNLNLNSNKFFYYSYGKLDIKLQAIVKDNNVSIEEVEDLSCIEDLEVNVSFEELAELLKREKMYKRDFNNLIKSIRENSSFMVTTEEGEEIFFIYEHLTIDKINKRIVVEFNQQAIRLFQIIRVNQFCNIDFSDIMNIKSKHQMNLYLYCLTVLRGNKGSIKIAIEKLRGILAGETLIDDYNFVYRFINKPSKEITENKDINLSIKANREGKNMVLNVERKIQR